MSIGLQGYGCSYHSRPPERGAEGLKAPNMIVPCNQLIWCICGTLEVLEMSLAWMGVAPFGAAEMPTLTLDGMRWVDGIRLTANTNMEIHT